MTVPSVTDSPSAGIETIVEPDAAGVTGAAATTCSTTTGGAGGGVGAGGGGV